MSCCTIFCPDETEETTTTRWFLGGEEVLDGRAEGAGGRLDSGSFAVLEPVEAAGPLLAGPVRDAEPDREQPQTTDREAEGTDQPAIHEVFVQVFVQGFLAEQEVRDDGRR